MEMINKQILFGIVLLIFLNIKIVFGQDDFNQVELSASKCLTDCRLYRLQERIISQELMNDTLTIKITKITNCADNKIGFARITHDTLFLSSSGLPHFEIDKVGDSVKYFLQTDCDCGYDFTYKIPSQQKYDWVKYQGQFIYHRDNHLKDNQFKIIGNDTLINVEDYRVDCYRSQSQKEGCIYCYDDNSQVRSVYQVDSLKNRILSIYDENNGKVFMLHIERESSLIKVYKWLPNDLVEFNSIQSIDELDFGDYYDSVLRYF